MEREELVKPSGFSVETAIGDDELEEGGLIDENLEREKVGDIIFIDGLSLSGLGDTWHPRVI